VTAWFNQPYGLCANNRGHLYVCDFGNNRIRRVRVLDGRTDTVLGGGRGGGTACGGPGSVSVQSAPGQQAGPGVGGIDVASLNWGSTVEGVKGNEARVHNPYGICCAVAAREEDKVDRDMLYVVSACSFRRGGPACVWHTGPMYSL
jgi:hypothetical protein